MVHWRSSLAGGCVLLLGLFHALLCGCGQAGRDSSYANPNWRASMKSEVSFPLAGELTVTVGLSARMPRPDAGNLSVEWLRRKTNLRLEFVDLPAGPGDVDLGQMLRDGKLPDIVPEERFELGEEWASRLFVNVTEFPALAPRLFASLRSDPELLAGTLARTTEKGELFSPGSYRRDSRPYAGVLAYRRDLFEKLGLGASSWGEIAGSLAALKRAYPDSAPFSAYFDTLLALMPSWFGSGYDSRNVVYYDVERRDWFLGPYEEPFRELVTFLADLYGRGILDPDMFVGREDMTSRHVSSGSSFMAPWRGSTGPFFPFYGEGYGKLDENGAWDGKGAWMESLPLPALEGRRARATAALSSRVGPGWLVYNQSPRASEAVALLDLMYDPEVSLAMSLGPEGTAWERSGGRVRLKGSLSEAYLAGSRAGVMKALREQGLQVGLDLGGCEWSFLDALGLPASSRYRYYAERDLASNRLGIELPMQPGIRVPRERSFQEARANPVVALQTVIESGVASFIVGRKPLADWDAFRAEVRKAGGDKLLELYRSRAVLVDPAVLRAE
jgi:putative aldouronate transport system substrate-binding protein